MITLVWLGETESCDLGFGFLGEVDGVAGAFVGVGAGVFEVHGEICGAEAVGELRSAWRGGPEGERAAGN